MSIVSKDYTVVKKKSVILYADMVIMKGKGCEGTVSCICKKADDILVTEKREILSFTLNQNISTSLTDNL